MKMHDFIPRIISSRRFDWYFHAMVPLCSVIVGHSLSAGLRDPSHHYLNATMAVAACAGIVIKLAVRIYTMRRRLLAHMEASRSLATLGGTEPNLEDIKRFRADSL